MREGVEGEHGGEKRIELCKQVERESSSVNDVLEEEKDSNPPP